MSVQSRPNVVFMLADNVGWGDVSGHGGTMPTPQIDTPVGQGARLANYNLETQRPSTRSAILTGRLPVRTDSRSVPLPGVGARDDGATLLLGCAPIDTSVGAIPTRTARAASSERL